MWWRGGDAMLDGEGGQCVWWRGGMQCLTVREYAMCVMGGERDAVT